jgi:uncharacterized Zn finger protein
MAWGSWYGYRKPQTVSSRKAKAEKHLAAAAKKKLVYDPVRIEGRTIARSFWGKAWNHNLESYSDYENRLPRGRSYLSSGQVLDLKIGAGTIDALVMGSSLYRVEVRISELPPARWKALSAACAGKVGSLVELLQGRLSDQVMAVVTRPGEGLFPSPREITKSCSCPDWADLCKHVAAVLYGVGARLDRQPELLFLLRGVNHLDLIGAAAEGPLAASPGAPVAPTIADEDVAGIFGIELEPETRPEAAPTPKPARLPAKRKTPAGPMRPPARAGNAGKAGSATARKPKSEKATSASTTISADELMTIGVRRSAIQSWLMERVLVPTERRGVYRKTAYTDDRIAAYLERRSAGSG